MTDQETLYMMALTQVPSLSLTNLHLLIQELGSARSWVRLLPSTKTART